MLAKISNSFKSSLGNLISDSYESENNLGSIVSESTGHSMQRRNEKRKSKRFSQMFRSDIEEDTKRDFSSKPTFNMRSVSMVRFTL